MDRKWIVLVTMVTLTLLMFGCPKKEPEVVPPEPTTTIEQPTTDVAPVAKPAEPIDATPVEPPKTIQEIQQDAERLGLLGDVFYDFDKYDLRPDARERLARNAEYMQTDGTDLTFTLEGHCDERGTNEYNIALGQRRSTAALDYLVSLGVDRARFKTISYGEERPFCTESNEECWQKNRRARFVINGRLGG